jgi:acyl CoA:acetate/3-ketoacid CoA transferase alpha subunit/acyl CoA:acetate/3-ketoacid CoA transferase beta subunit
MLKNAKTFPECEGPSKVVSLSEAVRQLIKPRMVLHFAFTHSRANAVAFEIIRQYNGQQPGFSLIGAGMLEYAIAMVGAGLVKKMVAGFFGDTFPAPAPNRILQRAFKEGTVEFECWTNLTVCLGLLAGALDIECIPTRSLVGSSLIDNNPQSMRFVDSPFSGTKLLTIRALKPDITIIHGLAADAYGNTILSPPYGEAMWGVFASKGGVMVTAEQIVSTEVIRKHSSFVKVPGHIVKSVSKVPFGAHPQGISNFGLRELFEGYGEDYSFREEFRKAAKNEHSFQKWLEEWVLRIDHETYLHKLGHEMLAYLRKKADPKFWELQIQNLKLEPKKDTGLPEWKSNEAMIVAAANLITQEVENYHYTTVLAGIGASHLSAWLAKYKMNTTHFDLLTETGFYGYLPALGDPFIFNLANVSTCKMQSDFIQILGAIVGSEYKSCLGVLSSAEIDKCGNINSTKKPGEALFLVGGGGSNDVASNATEIIALSKHNGERLVERVNFITCPGARVRYLVTDKALLKKNDFGELVLAGCLTNGKVETLQERIQEAKQGCGWDLRIGSNVIEVPPPGEEDLQILRLFDPEGCFTG